MSVEAKLMLPNYANDLSQPSLPENFREKYKNKTAQISSLGNNKNQAVEITEMLVFRK